MMRKIKYRRAGVAGLLFMTVMSACFLTGCVDQHPEGTQTTVQPTETLDSMLQITDPIEKEAVEIAKAKVHSMGAEPRIIATSPAVAEICDRLELDLVGVCSSSSSIPERYEEITQVGAAMSPDMEIVSGLSPDWILSPSSLQSDLQPKYETIDTDWAFLNLRSVQGMYRSIQELGEIFDREEQAETQIKEFKDFCRKTAHKLFILNVTDKYLEEYKKQGFGCVFCGEEARFKLSEYELSGKKGAKMRMNINHATKAGVTVKEYKVLEKRDEFIENEFNRITNEWLEEKKGAMLNFTIGTVGLEDPMDKRYFYALNADGKIVAFVVFVPFLSKNAYMADITRHGKDAPGGVIETITYTAFNVFKEEGVEYGSLGVAPLAGLPENSKNPVEKLLKFVYDHLNECYGFKDLYRAKEKYSPTQWCPSYYVYLPKIPTPDMFYAIVKIQNPQGVFDYVRSFVREWEKRHKNNEKKS